MPVTGIAPLVLPQKKSADAAKGLMKFFAEHENTPHGILVANSFYTTEPTLYITSREVRAEYLLRENDFFVKMPGLKLSTSDIFVNQNGERGLKGRAQFAQFFH